jgi:hypothetical protein
VTLRAQWATLRAEKRPYSSRPLKPCDALPLLPVATQVSSLHANFLVNAGARGGGGAGATAAELRALIEAIRCQVIRRCKKWRIVI